jgi:6-methylsalicylate decarboxylase
MTNEIARTKAATAANCRCCPPLTRRHMLAGAAAIAAANVLPATVARAQNAKSSVIDTHYHFYPPAYQKAWLDWEDGRKIPHFANQLGWTPERAVDQLDKNGIATAVLSVASTPGVWFGLDAKGAQKMARVCNDYGAEMARDHKGRFGLFATLSMLDIDATLNEIEYAFGTLKADGVGLQTNYGDKWLGDPFFRPIFDELNRREAVVYVHPLVADCCGQLRVGALPAVIEVPHDTTRTITSLLLSGTLARLRDIKWLFSHAGGTIPMLAGRIDAFYGQRAGVAGGFAPDGVMAELRRHRERHQRAVDGGAHEVCAGDPDHVRLGLSVFSAQSDRSAEEYGFALRRPAGDRKRQCGAADSEVEYLTRSRAKRAFPFIEIARGASFEAIAELLQFPFFCMRRHDVRDS